MMKSSLRSWQEPWRVSNGIIIGSILLSIFVLSTVKVRYYTTPFSTAPRARRLISSPFSSIRHVSCGVVG
jgi:hypothetical protein